MLHFQRKNSKKAPKGSEGLPSDDANLEPGAGRVTALLQCADGKRPGTSFISKLEYHFRNISTSAVKDRIMHDTFPKFNCHDETKGSQRPSSINENPEESKTDKDAPSQGAPGKTTTFKPRDLSINMKEESQSWSIPEGDGPAELLEVCWLDVSGSMTPTKGKTYEISFKLSMNKKKSFGWEDPVSVMAKMGEEGEYKCVKVDLSQLGEDQKVFPSEKFRIEIKSDENTGNKETKLYFGLYEVWTNKWKGGLRIHEAIVQEVKPEDSASTSNTCEEESKVLEVTADHSTPTSSNPGQFHNAASNSSSQRVGSSEIVPDSASASNNLLDDSGSASHKEEEYRDKQNKVEGRKF